MFAGSSLSRFAFPFTALFVAAHGASTRCRTAGFRRPMVLACMALVAFFGITAKTASANTLSVSPSTGVVANQTVTLTATPGTTVPGGMWWITMDGTDCSGGLGSHAFACGAFPNAGNGGFIISTPPLSVGTHTFYAYYSATPPPGGIFPASQAAIAIIGVGRATATVSLVVTSGGNPVTTVASGSLVTLTATVTAEGTPFSPGVITFCDASVDSCTSSGVAGTAQLTSAGTAVLRLVPPVGAHQYEALFAGNAISFSSTSSPQSLTVTGSSSTTISSSGSAGNYALTGNVVVNGSAASPAGPVSFLDSTNSFALGTGTLGTGTAALSLSGALPTPNIEPQPESIAEGDFNGDGKLDLVTATPNYPGAAGPPPNGLSILLGNGDGSFIAGPSSPLANTYASFVTVGDFNNDGNADLAVIAQTASQPTPQVVILLGNGDGTFTAAAAAVGVPTGTCCLAMGDFNGDGNLDLAVANGQDTVTILS